MKQWDIYQYPFPDPIGHHPVVILTPNEQASNPDLHHVNVLMVVSLRTDRVLKKLEVALNGADGLDHLSAVKVLPIHLIHKKDLGAKRGSVGQTRQKAIAAKIREVYRLPV